MLLIKDWRKVNFNNSEEDRSKVIGAINHAFKKTRTDQVKRVLKMYNNANEPGVSLQHFASKNDFPTSVLELIEKFRLTDAVDILYERFFRMLDFTSSKRNGFQIVDVADSLVFSEIPEGSPVKIYKMAGDKVTVNFIMYGGGLGWHRTLFDDEEYVTIEDAAIAFNNKWAKKVMQVHYALIEAISTGQNTTWQAVDGSVPATDANYQALRDINTINKACETILTDLKDTFDDLGENTQLELIAPIGLKKRILRALTMQNRGLSGDFQGVQYNVRPGFTLHLSTTTDYYIGLPGRKSQSGNRMNLTVFDEFDAKTYSDIAVGWGRFGATIGQEKQIRRCKTS